MTDSLFLLHGDDSLTKMNSAEFVSEEIFQKLLARFPDLLTDSDFGEGSARRWILIGRETGVPSKEGGAAQWSLDHLFLDQDGVPTLVEIKRATDTRARREVVAQMLDYAANAVSWWRVDELAKWFDKSCEEEGVKSYDRLSALLQTDSPDVESFWRSVQANLSSGRIRMIFVADRIAPELQRIVEFLNEQMSQATVAALELRPFASGGDRILAPRLIGATARAIAQKKVAGTAESAEDWFATVFAGPDPSRESARHFINIITGLGASPKVASQSLALDYATPVATFRIAYIRPTGKIALSGWMLRKAKAFELDDARLELLQDLASLGFRLSNRNPSGECSFDLPAIGDAVRWPKLQEFFARLINKLS